MAIASLFFGRHLMMPCYTFGRCFFACCCTCPFEALFRTGLFVLFRGCPLKKSVWMIREFNKSSSDDRPGPGICTSKYVEDEKAARSVRVWDRVPIRKESPQTNV